MGASQTDACCYRGKQRGFYANNYMATTRNVNNHAKRHRISHSHPMYALH